MTEQTTVTPAPTESYTPAHLSARAYGPPVTRGRVLMYTSADGEEVPRGTVHFAFMVGFDHDRGPGTWRWPERV